MEKISIMLVDDHLLVREALSYTLRMDERIEIVAECDNGKQAIVALEDKKPNILILDINMPEMNGIEVMGSIGEYLTTTKVICLTMHSEPGYVKKMLNLGASGYLTKNSPSCEVLKAIMEVHQGGKYICQDAKDSLSDEVFICGKEGTNPLSKREIEIANLVRKGLSSAEIAEKLEISIKTVESNRYHILKKMKLKNTVSLVNALNRNGEI